MFARLIGVLLASCCLLAEDGSGQVFRAYAADLTKRGDPADVLAWDGGRAERGIDGFLRRGGAEAWGLYVSAGLAAAQRYPDREFRLAEYWRPYAEVLALPDVPGGRAEIDRLLARADVPARVKGWILQHLLGLGQQGLSLSWLAAAPLVAHCRGALLEPFPVMTLRFGVAVPPPEPLKPGPNRSSIRTVELVIDSRRQAAWILEDMLLVPTRIPRDPATWGTAAEAGLWDDAVAAAIRLLPIAEARAQIVTGATVLIDQREALPAGPEQMRAVVRSSGIALRADAASLVQRTTWALALLEAGDPLAGVAAEEMLQTVDRGLRAGSYLPSTAGIVEAGRPEAPMELLAAIPPTRKNLFTDAKAVRPWITPFLVVHRDAARRMPGSLAEREWLWAASALGVELPGD